MGHILCNALAALVAYAEIVLRDGIASRGGTTVSRDDGVDGVGRHLVVGIASYALLCDVSLQLIAHDRQARRPWHGVGG